MQLPNNKNEYIKCLMEGDTPIMIAVDYFENASDFTCFGIFDRWLIDNYEWLKDFVSVRKNKKDDILIEFCNTEEPRLYRIKVYDVAYTDFLKIANIGPNNE